MADRTTIFVPGKIYWPKIVGDRALHDNYEGDAREWSYDFVPDDTSFLKEHRLLDRLKEARGVIDGDYLRMKKSEFTKDGDKNEPIRIYNNDPEVTDAEGAQLDGWDERLIGNGTEVVAKLQIVKWGAGKKSSIYTQALRVEKLVPYASDEFGGYDGKKPEKSPAKQVEKRQAKRVEKDADAGGLADDDLEDDLPF